MSVLSFLRFLLANAFCDDGMAAICHRKGSLECCLGQLMTLQPPFMLGRQISPL